MRRENRKTAVAGRFYPADREELLQFLKASFEFVPTEKKHSGRIRALIAPHAGYVFSGQVAASAFAQIPEKATYENVFVLATSHCYRFRGASVYTRGNYETPLGEIEVNTEIGKALCQKSSLFTDDPAPHLPEHSLEVQLPFLQYRLGKAIRLVPIILGAAGAEECRQIANCLKEYFTRNNLWVVSTDFSHFPSYENASKVDRLTADAIASGNPKMLLERLEKNRELGIPDLETSLCGWTSVLTLLYLTHERGFRIEPLVYKNSGDAPLYGDKNRVVGYWAMGLYERPVFEFSPDEEKQILTIARNAIALHWGLHDKISETAPVSEKLNEKAGAFVSIYLDGKLRGCIGGFAGQYSLKDMLERHAVNALYDRRFPPLHAGDFDHLKLEVSVLSPLQKVDSADDIELGRHGIVVQKGLHSGTFLPQVAEKYQMSKDEFLGRCARDKAGIGWNGWKDADLFVYEAVVINED